MEKPESVTQYMRRAYLISATILIVHSLFTMFILFPPIPSDGPIQCGSNWFMNTLIAIISLVAFAAYWAVWRNIKMAFLFCLPTWIWALGFILWCHAVLPHGT